jgi:hypothetical protein
MESNDSNAVEVDGVRFETLVPERVLTIPNRNGAKNHVQFGIRFTNLSPSPYRFIFFYLLPQLLAPDGQAIHRCYGVNGIKIPQESDFLLAMPGENLTFFLDAQFSWSNHKLRLGGYARNGGVWHFDALKPGIYRVRFTYENRDAVRKIYYGGSIEGLWTGMVSTPFVSFRLVQP